MKKKVFLVFLLFVICGPVFPQIKVVSFKKLQQFLPSVELKGFTRQKPTGMTQNTMGMATSQSSVEYAPKPPEKETDSANTASIKITIQDATLMPYMLAQFAMLQQGYESESESGYEKALTVQNKYPGKLSCQTGDYKSCKIEFGVMNRFLLQLEGSNFSDPALLYQLIDKMDLENLAKVEADK